MKTTAGIITEIYSGHVAMYVGQIDGVDYVVEATANGVVKTPARYFINEAGGEKFLGAKLPKDLSPLGQAKVVALAKSLAEKKLGYDFSFKEQKGPGDGDWTCVGLTEKIYESAAIANPNNLGALEYDPNYYDVDITPDGFSPCYEPNKDGDCFSTQYEFSPVAARRKVLIPAPELIGFDAGREYEGQRYIFFPYTQLIQPTLEDVPVDIEISSSFKDEPVRGEINALTLVLQYSLINNPLSALKSLFGKVERLALDLKNKIFPPSDSELALANESVSVTAAPKKTAAKTTAKAAAVKKAANPKVTVVKKSSAAPKSETVARTSSETAETKITTDTVGAAMTQDPVNKNSVTVHKTETASAAMASPTTTTATVAAANSVATIVGQTNSNNTTVSNSSNSSVNSNASDNSSSSTSTNETSSPGQYLAIISQIYSTGSNDWLKLFNPTDHDFDLATANYRLEKAKTAADPSLIMRIGNPADGQYPGGTTIPAHDYYLIVRNDANVYYKSQADALATRDDFSWGDSGYTLYLGNDALSSYDDPDILEAVGFGTDATYYTGSGPAPTITDNYILNRVATSGDNHLDFNLIPSDDPGIDWSTSPAATGTDEIATSSEATATGSSETATSTDQSVANPDLFSAPTPIDSDGLTDLWHFDECYGDGDWAVGRWDCARRVGYGFKALTAGLSPGADLNSFTLSFYFKKDGQFPRFNFDLANADQALNLILERSLLTINGLPNSQGRYYGAELFLDDDWHQATLSADWDQGVWIFYLDGQEKYRATFAARLPFNLSDLKIFGDGDPALIDEIALWNRPLAADEVLANYLAAAPFAPLTVRPPQTAATLLYDWDFNEGDLSGGASPTAIDSVGGETFNIRPADWFWRAQADSGVIIGPDSGDLAATFAAPLATKDMSLSFWWRNQDPAVSGRTVVTLKKGDKKQFGLLAACYRTGFYFNNQAGTLIQDLVNGVPCDQSWHHLALVYDSYRYILRLYSDGEEIASTSQIWLKDADLPTGVLVKSDNGNTELDDLKIWSGALSAAQVKQVYTGD